MTAKAVLRRSDWKQYTSVALQVDGAYSPITWCQLQPKEQTIFQIPDGYGIYFSRSTNLADRATVRLTALKEDVVLGTAYSWDGKKFTEAGSWDEGTIRITNLSKADGTFGLTKKDPDGKHQPICADILANCQQKSLTPVMAIYAVMGNSYPTNSVPAHIDQWRHFTLRATQTSFTFDDDTSSWHADPTGQLKFLATKVEWANDEREASLVAQGNVISNLVVRVAGNTRAAVLWGLEYLEKNYPQSKIVHDNLDDDSEHFIVNASERVDPDKFQTALNQKFGVTVRPQD